MPKFKEAPGGEAIELSLEQIFLVSENDLTSPNNYSKLLTLIKLVIENDLSPYTGEVDGVGSLGNKYATVKDAYDDGKKYVFVSADVTETADITLSSTSALCVFVSDSVTWSLGAYKVTSASGSNGESITIVLACPSSTFKYTDTPFSNFDASSQINIYGNGGAIVNEAATAKIITTLGSLVIKDCKFIMPNAASNLISTNDHTVLSNINFVGAGDACEYVISLNGGNVDSISFTGSFKNGAILNSVTKATNLSNITYNSASNASLYLIGNATNIIDVELNLTLIADSNCSISNAKCSGLVFLDSANDITVLSSQFETYSGSETNDKINISYSLFSENIDFNASNSSISFCNFSQSINTSSSSNGTLFSCNSDDGSTILGTWYRKANNENIGNDADFPNVEYGGIVSSDPGGSVTQWDKLYVCGYSADGFFTIPDDFVDTDNHALYIVNQSASAIVTVRSNTGGSFRSLKPQEYYWLMSSNTGLFVLSTNYVDIVTEDKTQTLTNKTIDGDNNTITNIGETSIKDGAVTLDKLGGESVSTTKLTPDFLLSAGKGGTGISLDGDILSDAGKVLRINATDDGFDKVTLGALADKNTVATTDIDNNAVTPGKMDLTQAYHFTAGASGINGTSSTDYVTYQQLLALSDGSNWKNAVKVASGTNINLASVPADIDSVTMATGERFLVFAQTTETENGIYVYPSASGEAASRSSDMDANAEFPNAKVPIAQGTYDNHTFQCISNNVILGSTDIVFIDETPPEYMSGDAIDLTAATISVKFDDASISLNGSDQLQIKPITPSRAVVSDGSGALTASSVTASELGYVSGVTSALQTQINAKAPLASPSFTGTPVYNTTINTNTTDYTIANTLFVSEFNIKFVSTITTTQGLTYTYFYNADPTSADFSVTLPSPTGTRGKFLGITNSGTTGKVTVNANGGSPTVEVLYPGDVLWVLSTGSVNVVRSFYQRTGSEPVGTLKMWSTDTAPAHYLVRDGAAISRTTYWQLFEVIGTTFGAGDGSTTFNLPNDLGLFERGWDSGGSIDPARSFGSTQDDAIKAHTHSLPTEVGANAYNWLFSAGGAGWNQGGASATGSTGGTETRPKNRAYLPIIKYQ